MKCALCDHERNVVDGKDQALLCEGLCKCWYHRHCAGVSVVHFEALSSSSDPFYFAGCFQTCCNEELANLKNTISILRGEVTLLCEALEEKSKNNTATIHHSASDVRWKRSRGVVGVELGEGVEVVEEVEVGLGGNAWEMIAGRLRKGEQVMC